mgnify:CR=1 FL=1
MKDFTLIKWDDNNSRVAYGYINDNPNIIQHRNTEDINAYAVFGEVQTDVDNWEINLESYEVYNLDDEQVENVCINFEE